MVNRQFLLASHPTGHVASENFRLTTAASPGPPEDGMVIVQHELIMSAPTVRNFISGRTDRPHPVVQLGQPVIAPAVGRVVQSANCEWPLGTRFVGIGSWQDFAHVDPRQGFRPLPPTLSSIDALGRFGPNAQTAYGGLRYVAEPKAGETLVVSGASGSVGCMVMQIGRNLGCRVVGICGGGEKADWLRQTCGFQDLINYKSENVEERLRQICPSGIDIYFDNVGGDMLRTVVGMLNKGGRVALCGQIATYDGDDAGNEGPPLDMMRLVYGRIKLQGFIGSDFNPANGELMAQLQHWYEQGTLHHRVDVREGFEELPLALMALFSGDHSGTLTVRISREDGEPI